MRFALLGLLVSLTIPTIVQGEGRILPLVSERYDDLYLVHEQAESQTWQMSRVLFVRKGQVIAERVLCDDMLFWAHGPQYVLAWNDYGSCHRLVRADRLIEITVHVDNQTSTDHVPWWGMGRRMTDLEAPHE